MDARHPLNLDAEDLPHFPEDNAPPGFTICELCSRVTGLSDYHKHIGGAGCVAEARRNGYTHNKPRGWVPVPLTRRGSGRPVPIPAAWEGTWEGTVAEFFAKYRIPYHEPTGSVQPWVAAVVSCNASDDDRLAGLIRCLRDVEHRRAVVAALRLFGGEDDEPELVGQVLRGE